jgi:hypothetical protein
VGQIYGILLVPAGSTGTFGTQRDECGVSPSNFDVWFDWTMEKTQRRSGSYGVLIVLS